MRPLIACLAASVMWAASAFAQLQARSVEYREGGTVLQGYLAYDDAAKIPSPGVLVVHEWKGLGTYAKRRAEQLAKLGYVAFAADMYGKGVYAKDHEAAAALSGVYRNDRRRMRSRILAALDLLRQDPRVDSGRIAAIGYCFGGMTVLELARSGAAILGVVSFHGGLQTPHPEDAKAIRGKVLVLHGANDPFVTQAEVATFEHQMRAAGADYQLIQYDGAVHSFTVPDAGHDPSSGMAYDKEADKRSWEAMQAFLEALFAG